MELPLQRLQGWALAHKIVSTSAIIALYIALYNIGLVLHHLVFSNLTKFPGPKIAAATYWYEFYQDYLEDRKYVFVIEGMHKKYGSCMNRLLRMKTLIMLR